MSRARFFLMSSSSPLERAPGGALWVAAGLIGPPNLFDAEATGFVPKNQTEGYLSVPHYERYARFILLI
jgi:hypothetical protein